MPCLGCFERQDAVKFSPLPLGSYFTVHWTLQSKIPTPPFPSIFIAGLNNVTCSYFILPAVFYLPLLIFLNCSVYAELGCMLCVSSPWATTFKLSRAGHPNIHTPIIHGHHKSSHFRWHFAIPACCGESESRFPGKLIYATAFSGVLCFIVPGTWPLLLFSKGQRGTGRLADVPQKHGAKWRYWICNLLPLAGVTFSCFPLNEALAALSWCFIKQ